MLKRVLMVGLLLLGLLAGMVAVSPPSFAADTVGSRAAPLLLTSWPVILAGFCGIASTHLTELLAHTNAPQWVKSGINLALSTLAGIIITVQTVAGHTWKDYAAEIGVAWVLSMFTHWSGLTAWIQNTFPGGIGGNTAPIVPPAPAVDTSTGAA